MLRGLLRFVFALGLIAIAWCSFMPLLWRWLPQSVALVPMAPQFAAAALLLALCFLLLKTRKTALLAFGIAAWNVLQFWPALGDLASNAAADAAAPPLKVVSFNLWYRNDDSAEALAYLAHSGADVIGLVEVTPRLKATLAPLKVLYPYGIDCVEIDPSCEIMLLSKHPLQQAYAGKIDDTYPYVAEGEISWNGRPVTIAMTHLAWPFMGLERPALNATSLGQSPPELPDVPRLTQSRQAANLAHHVNGLPEDLVLMGDFNSASWSSVQTAFRAATGLENRGHYLPSWPAYAPPVFRIPIDQVFVRGAWRVLVIRLGPTSAPIICWLKRRSRSGHKGGSERLRGSRVCCSCDSVCSARWR